MVGHHRRRSSWGSHAAVSASRGGPRLRLLFAHAKSPDRRPHDPRQHARQRRANARRVVSRSRLQSPSGSRRERLSRREAALRIWCLRLSRALGGVRGTGRLKRRPSHNSPKCPKFRSSVSELGQQQAVQKEKTAVRRSLRNPILCRRYLISGHKHLPRPWPWSMQIGIILFVIAARIRNIRDSLRWLDRGRGRSYPIGKVR